MYYMANNSYQEKQKNYEDARKDLLQAIHSFSKLDPEQKKQLLSELVQLGIGMEMLRQSQL